MLARAKEQICGMVNDGRPCVLVPLLFATIFAASWAWLFWYVNRIGTTM
jgi:hypothetical protein